ncbi:MAG TPA: tetratricopeptide repeat protein [Polyangiales bacterium]|nr:tetratricopeptide repeat protein [Polyangiales bacterium]
MSLFGKLFGKRSAEEERAHADQLFAAGEFGQAKLSYERVQTLTRDQPELQSALVAQIDACRDAIAKKRLEEAERLIAAGNLEFAREELQGAIETAASRELIALAEQRAEGLEEKQWVQEHPPAAEIAAEDRFEVIAGGFEEDQYAEYLAHGEPMKRALLLLHDGKMAEARSELEALIAKADAPRFLWFELGRARLATGETEAGAEALNKFLESLHAEEGGDARLLAHMELAQLVHAKGDFDGAVAHYERALEALPDDPRPYLAMAAFFRREQLFDEAIEVLEAALAARAEQDPDFRLWHELGLAYADAGKDDAAIAQLERVVEFLTRRNQRDLPPEGTLRLAALYEKSERPARALDLFTLLANGSDQPNLFAYQLEAARLMQKLGLSAEARRMLQRAREAAPKDPAVQARVEELAQSLSGSVQSGS